MTNTSQDNNLKEKKRQLLLARNKKVEQIGQMITARNHFYRSNLNYLIMTWVLLGLALVLLITVLYYSQIKQQQAWFIQAKLNGQVITTEDLRIPSFEGKEITNLDVVDWALNAVPIIYNYDFLNDKGNFRNIISLFTPKGYVAYVDAVYKSKILETIKKTATVSLGVGCGRREDYIVKQGVEPIEGYPVYSWSLEIPFVARNISPSEKEVVAGYLELGVQRIPQLMASDGLALWKFVFREEKRELGDMKFEALCNQYFGV